MLRLLKRIFFLLLLLVLIAAGGFGLLWLDVSHDGTGREGRMSIPGLSDEARVLRDDRGVPHIFAANRQDAMRALGYVHAQDRLWQMEMQRRIGAGRLSEILGSPGLQFDRFTRALGLYARARVDVTALDPGLKADLDAYVSGVNAFISDPDIDLPPEYGLLLFAPEPWTAADSLVWGKLMALQLSGNWYREVLEAALREILPADRVDSLFPDGPAGTPTSLASDSGTGQPARPTGIDFAGLLDILPKALVQDSASNAWVANGARTGTGGALLANDPHLGFTSPNLWYLARIVTPEETLVGATVPGVPLLVIGRNDRLAWGFTTTHADTQDLVIETRDPTNAGRYLTPDGPLPFRTREETFVVRFGSDETLTVRETRHGVVLSDIQPDRFTGLTKGASDKLVALMDAALIDGPDGSANALWRLNRAGSVAEGGAALADFAAPIQNVHLADNAGSIGMIAPGRLPIRAGGLDGLVPIDGARTRQAWYGFVPFSSMPQRINPPSGVLYNANGRLVGPDYPFLVTKRWPEGFRQLRLGELIDATADITLEKSLSWQMDDFASDARLLLPLMLRIHPVEPRLQQAVTLLQGWDYHMRADRPEPLLYQAWTRALVRDMTADELGALANRYWSDHPLFLLRVLTRESSWCDRVDTEPRESCDFILENALAEAVAELTQTLGQDIAAWRWGDVHQARFEHRPLGMLPILGSSFGGEIATNGGDHTLNRGQTPGGASSHPYAHRHGPGLRVVIDMADPDRSLFQIAMGQNGNAFGPNFDDWLTDWGNGTYRTLAGSPAQLRRAGARELILVPAR